MSNFLVSLIRTYVPVVIGAIVAWVCRKMGWVTPDTSALATAFTGLVIGAYYAGARLLEKKWPAAGWLLGAPKQPEYVNPPPAEMAEE